MKEYQAHALAEERVRLANEYARLSERLAEVLAVKTIKWAVFRAEPDCKSDAKADRAWEATPEGLEEMRIKLKMKAYERQMSAQGTMLRVMENEERAQYQTGNPI